MAITNRNSTTVANLVATPRVINKPPLAGGMLRTGVGVVASAADDSATSVYRMFRVPSNAVFYDMLISAADASSGGAVNIGLHQTAENGGAVVDADLFTSALDLSGGPYKNSSVLFESTELTNAESVTPLWQAIGLSSDPNIEYDVTISVSTDFNGGPTSIKLVGAYWQ